MTDRAMRAVSAVACIALLWGSLGHAGFSEDPVGADPGFGDGGGWSDYDPPYGDCWEDPSDRQFPACGANKVPERISFKILFEFDRYVVPDTVVNRSVLATIDNYIRKVKRSPAREYITIVGHTDARGSDSYNMELGLRRATAVRNYFIAQGYPASLLAPAQSRGKRQLLPEFSPYSVEQRRVVITKVDR